MSLDSQTAYFAQFIALTRTAGRIPEMPVGTVAVFRADLPTVGQNDQPATSSQALIFGSGTTGVDGTLTTIGTMGAIITTPYLTGTNAALNNDVFFTLVDAGPGTGDASLALFSVGAEDDLDSYAKITISADPIGQRSLVLNAYDKGAAGGVTARLPAGLGFGGVHSFRIRISPVTRQFTLMHLSTTTSVTATLPTYSWTGRLCAALGGAYRGLQGVTGNRTPRGAEKFLEVRSLGFAFVARHTLTSDANDVASIIVSDYRHPTISVQPALLSLTAGAAPTVFRATLENSGANPVWTLEGPGSIVVSGLEVTYTPPGTISATSQAIIRAQAVGGATFESVITLSPAATAGAPVINSFSVNPTSVNSGGTVTASYSVTGATSLVAGDGAALTPLTSGTFTRTVSRDTIIKITATNAQGSVSAEVLVTVAGDATVNSYTYDPNFNHTTLPNGQAQLYRRAIDGAKLYMDTGRTYVHGAPNYYWSDVNANGAARGNTSTMNYLIALFTQTKAGEIIGILADRFELNMNGMKAVANGEDPPAKYFPEGVGLNQLKLKEESYYNTLVTVTNDDGTTFQTRIVDMPRPLYVRATTSGTAEGKAVGGTDTSFHDITPRLSGYVAVLMVLDQNRSYNRGAGKESIASICDWGYNWFYKYLAFLRYRAANSTFSEFQGSGRLRDGMIDWREDIGHDVFQQLFLDWAAWEWARLREGASSTRALFWEGAYRKRLSWIEQSMMFVTAPNGIETVLYGHHMAKFRNAWRSKSINESWGSGTGGWLLSYSDDVHHCINIMALLGAPGILRVAKALANHFTQVAWHSNTKLAVTLTGIGNVFSNGAAITYNSSWPSTQKMKSSATNWYDYVNENITVGDKSRATIKNRFHEVQGFEIMAFDPTANQSVIKRAYELSAIYQDYTPAKGQAQTKSNVKWVIHQIVDLIISKRFGVNPTTLD